MTIEEQLQAAQREVMALREALEETERAFQTRLFGYVRTDDEHGVLGRVNELLARTAESYANLAVVERDRLRELEKDSARLEWLHTCGIEGQPDRDADGWEWGVARVHFDKHGQVIGALWTDSDHTDLDAAIAARSAPKAEKGGVE